MQFRDVKAMITGLVCLRTLTGFSFNVNNLNLAFGRGGQERRKRKGCRQRSRKTAHSIRSDSQAYGPELESLSGRRDGTSYSYSDSVK